MTSNQLTLGKLREDIRHNRATEQYGYATLGETKRHNIKSEQIGFGNIGLGYSQLAESKRHNIATEGLGYSQLAESRRHNIATEDYQGQQALAYAGKAKTDAAYTDLQIKHYIDELKVRQDNAEANLQNAATAERRAEIEQQLADIKADLAYWEKQRTKTQMLHDITSSATDIVDAVNGVVGVVGSLK